MSPVSIETLAERAGVDEAYVRRLEELGAIRELPEPLPITYREFAEREGIPLELLQGIQEAMGFAAPEPDDRVARDDADLAGLLRIVLEIGGTHEGARRLFRPYADNLRRLATADAELYIEELETPWRGSGRSEADIMQVGAEIGRRIAEPVDATLKAIYQRLRQHVWAEFSIQRAEIALERAGLFERVESTPAICFVDMTGYTRLTEERGDEEAARLATTLAALVDSVSRTHGRRAIRWLGDGGLFYFEETRAAFLAALEMSERAPQAGLPPTHIGSRPDRSCSATVTSTGAP